MSNVIVAFPRTEDANAIKGLLVRSGFRVQGVCTTYAQAIQIANEMEQGVLVCGYKLQDRICLDFQQDLPRNMEMLVVASKRVWELCAGKSIMCLEMPLKAQELVETLEMMMRAGERRRRLERNKPKNRNNEEKEVILKAKLALMERHNMVEEDAYRYIQKHSMDSGNSMVETAQMLLSMMN